jgi:hypothetical protein
MGVNKKRNSRQLLSSVNRFDCIDQRHHITNFDCDVGPESSNLVLELGFPM